MTTKVFYSFHYDRDWWRVNTVRQIGALEEQNMLDSQQWERVQRRGDAAIQAWIKEQMRGRDALVVLAGAETALRRWVQWEIRYAWRQGIPMCGVRINRLKDQYGQTDPQGLDPFAQISMTDGSTMDRYVTLHDPYGWDSQSVYSNIATNLPDWISRAYSAR